MRKITSDVVGAFLRKEKRTQGNTHTDGEKLYLHDNMIACHSDDGIIVTLAGWPTATTRERLNAIPGVNLVQRKGIQYLNGRELMRNEFRTITNTQ
jgi:hypothetical protein